MKAYVDLDETLVSCRYGLLAVHREAREAQIERIEAWTANPETRVKFSEKYRANLAYFNSTVKQMLVGSEPYVVFPHPQAVEFLENLGQVCESVDIYTAAHPLYAHAVLEAMGLYKFVEKVYSLRLNPQPAPESPWVLYDDTPAEHKLINLSRLCPGKLIRVDPFGELSHAKPFPNPES